MTSARWWDSTPRELEALAETRDRYLLGETRNWAAMMTLYANVHYRGEGHRQAWTVADFLSGERKPQPPEHTTATLDLHFGTGEVPEWALAVARNQEHINGSG